MTNVKAMTFQGEDVIKAYVCGDCGKHWAAETRGFTEMNTEDRGHQYADKCCRERKCYDCGALVSWYGICHDCHEVKRAKSAEVVEYDGGYIYSNAYGSNEGYADSVEEMFEWIRDDFDDCCCMRLPDGADCDHNIQAYPSYVHLCRETPFFLDIESILENVLEDHHEDAGSQLVGVDALIGAVDAFNSKQTLKSYYPDYTKIVILDQKKFDDYVKVCVDKVDSKG